MKPHVVYYEANVDGIIIHCHDVNKTEEAIQNAEEWARRLQAMHGAKTVKWKASTPIGVVSAGTIKALDDMLDARGIEGRKLENKD